MALIFPQKKQGHFFQTIHLMKKIPLVRRYCTDQIREHVGGRSTVPVRLLVLFPEAVRHPCPLSTKGQEKDHKMEGEKIRHIY